MAEAGLPAYRSTSLTGMLVLRGTPGAIVDKVAEKLVSLMNFPALQQQIINGGSQPGLLMGEAFERFLREDMECFGVVAKAANLTAE